MSTSSESMQMESMTGLEIAVIGMAGKFPGARTIDEFWDNLKNGVESISFFSDEEFIKSRIAPALIKDANFVKAGGVLAKDIVESFDSYFFDYFPKEAEKMDPQVRIFHECAWEALEHAGYNPGSYPGLIGVYAGASSNFNWEVLSYFPGASGEADMDPFAIFLLADRDFLSSHVSYKLDLKGPVVTLQTACSTSLAAIHQACRALLTGECDMALAGGVTVRIPQRRGYLYKPGMIRSPDGHCRAFDAAANGMIGGNGIGIVVLKRLNTAIRDRDNLHAVIKGSAMNNDGNRKVGYTAPSVEGQAEVIKAAHQAAEVEPETIGFIETHGTATSLGDPVEVEALKLAFNTGKKGFCAIGSIKTNLGHLDSAAGVASFIKTVLALKYKLIPPSLHFENPNPKIDFENSPFRVNTKLTPWKKNEYPRRAGVSSLGIGGTNVHVILEEAPQPVIGHSSLVIGEDGIERDYQLILLSAKTGTALDKIAQNLAHHFKKNPHINLADAAYTLQVGRKAMAYRSMLVCSNPEEAVEKIQSGEMETGQTKEEKSTVIFMFSGQGSQYVNMGLDLYQQEPIFRHEVDRCFELLEKITGKNMKPILYPDLHTMSQEINKAEEKIYQFLYTTPIKFIFEYSLATLLMKWGIQPGAMIGHSFGEYVCACISGVFCLEDGLFLSVLRGELMHGLPEGAMLSVPLSEEDLKPFFTDELSLAAVNGQSICVVSGPVQAINNLEKELNEKGHKCLRYQVPKAGHSRMVETIMAEFKEKIAAVRFHKPKIPYISGMTGTWITVGQAVDPGYWTRHLRQTVRFADGLTTLFKEPDPVFLQVGPGRGLTLFVRQHPDKKPGSLTVNLVRHPQDHTPDNRYLLNKIGLLWLYGITVDWSEFHSRDARNRIPLPTYPFERERYRVDEGILKKIGNSSWELVNTAPPLPGKKPEIGDWFYVPLWEKSLLPLKKQKSSAPAPAINWLVFVEPGDFGSKFIQMLAPHARNIIRVSPGPVFARKSQQEYTINLLQENDYHRLFREIRNRDAFPGTIVHCWGVGEDPTGPTGFAGIDRIREKGFYSLLSIARAVDKEGISSDIKIDVITDNMQDVIGTEVLYPGKALLLGAVKVIPREYPHIRCRSIDIESPQNGSLPEKTCWYHLLRELVNDSSHQVIALRGRHRWTPVIKAVSFYTAVQPGEGLRENGVYLVTGGLGGIGLTLALYLARHVKARLILTSRSSFPPGKEWERRLIASDTPPRLRSKMRKLLEMKKCGSQVMVLWADVSNPGQMKHIVASSEKRFGTINGVIHAAGVPDGGLIQARTLEITESVFKAKVKGTLVLEQIFQDKPLDFFILCSSLAFIPGPLGPAAYTAANAFQDAFAQYKAHNNGQWNSIVSINWDTWQQVGRTGPDLSTANEINPEQQLKHGLLPEESSEIFQRIIGIQQLQIPQVVISTHDFMSGTAVGDTWQQPAAPGKKEETAPGKSTTSLRPRHGMSKPYASPTNQIEKELAQIWQNFLGIRQIGIYDDFFELGGDSLKAITLASKIHKNHDVEIPVREFFNHPTIQEIAGYISNAKKSVYARIESVEKKEYYALSSVQKRIYILQQMESGNISYNIPQIIPLVEAIEPIKLENTIKKLITRHDSLRTSFEMIAETLVQRIHQEVDFAIEYYEARKNEGRNISNRFTRPFDLSQPPLLRVGIEKTVSSPPLLLVDMHHIITDGISQIVLQREFMSLYRDEELLPLRLQYKDYAHWHNSEKQQILIKQQEEYWINMFSNNDEIPVLNLPTDYSRPLRQSFEGSSVSFVLTGNEPKALKALSQEVNTTLFMTILSIFTILLSKLSDQEDIIVGVPIAARRHADLENIIGMFANTLAIRNYPSGEKSFREFLIQVKERTLKAFENQEYPFEELVEKVPIQRDISRNPIFDVMFNLLNQSELNDAIDMPVVDGQDGHQYGNRKRTAKFELTLTGIELEDKINFSFEFCTKIFKKETIERWIRYYKNIVCSILDNHRKIISGLEMISIEEKDQLLYGFNQTGTKYPEDKTIDQLFEAQVERTPDNIALLGSKLQITNNKRISITYRELNKKANQMAHLLVQKGVKADTIVGLMVEHSPEMIVGILGILKAGGAYVPLNQKVPNARAAYILEECNAYILLIDQYLLKNVKKIGSWSGEIVVIAEHRGSSALIPGAPWAEKQHADRLAYIIYTSGSTGQPKGVPITHSNLSPLLHWGYTCLGLSSRDRTIRNLAYYFDWSIWEIFITLTSGAGLYIVSDEVLLNSEACIVFMNQYDITVLHVTPTQYQYLLHANQERLGLKYLFIGAEKLTYDLVQRSFMSVNESCRVFNMYGPTEATIISAVLEINRKEYLQYKKLSSIPIGHSVGNTNLLILDKYLKLLPLHVTGELYITSEGLTMGYLNNPEFTAKKFVEQVSDASDRFWCTYRMYLKGAKRLFLKKAPPGRRRQKIYRTGDLARWLLDGNIEFLGRIDHQVKIRGFRIELGDIQSKLAAYPGIKETVVIDKEINGEKCLCAYVVSHNEIHSAEIRDKLSETLPEYMIPSYFIRLVGLPLNPNGKIDRKALPHPEIIPGTQYIPPRNEIEKRLVKIWAKILHLDQNVIGIDHNFFELGGHSIKATITVFKLQEEFNVKVPMAALFKTPSIRSIATFIREAGGDICLSLESVEQKEYYKLSSAQKRLFITQQLDVKSTLYNLPQLIVLKEDLEIEKLEVIFKKLISRHESLRTLFYILDGIPVQKILPEVPFAIDFFDIADSDDSQAEIKTIIRGFTKPFPLFVPPLFRASLIGKKKAGRFLLLDMHHIISDGVSQEILKDEFDELCQDRSLPQLKLQYKDYAEYQNFKHQKHNLEAMETYWLRKFSDPVPVLQLPLDFTRPPVRSHRGDTIRFEIPGEIIVKVRQIILEKGGTPFIFFLTVYTILISHYSNQAEIVIGAPVTGREQADLQNIVGFFVNMLPLRNHPRSGITFSDFLEEVKINTVEAFENQDYQYLELVNRLNLHGDSSRNPLFDVVFQFQNQGEAQMPGDNIASVGTDGEKILSLDMQQKKCHFDLYLFAYEAAGAVKFKLEYSTALFKNSTVEKIAFHFREIITQVAKNPGISLEDIRLSHDFIHIEPTALEEYQMDF